MGVCGYSVHVFICKCDVCDLTEQVEENSVVGIYNGAQAVRSLGWSFGKDKRVLCNNCRRYRGWNDKYTSRGKK